MVDFDSEIRPFFQVVIRTCDAKFDAKLFTAAFKKTLADKNKLSSSHYFSIQQEDIQADFIAFHIIHKSLPTWYNREPKAISKKDSITEVENLENDILLIYLSSKHIFFHSNCRQVLTLITETIDILIEHQKWEFNNLSAEILMVILKQLELEFKTLGILNVFNAGGIAPEAKAYFGRNTAENLTPSFDSGFGFSYGLGSLVDKDNNRKPFGCSLSKSKIWGTWVDDIDDFIEKCEEILKWIKNKKAGSTDSLEVLISPTTKKSLATAVPFEFYMDYFVQNKGMVGLTGNSSTMDWDCYVSPKDHTKIIFNLNYPKNSESTELTFGFDAASEKIVFNYADPKSTIKTFCQGVEDDEHKEQDLVKYLNKQKNFTIVFGGGFAFRNKECWIDNRLKQPFKQAFAIIDWVDVDIKKEDKPPVGKRYNILEKINVHFQAEPDKILTINDNGANEVGDYLFLGEDRLILIHAKYSSNKAVGLRVDDLQVVSSQALKNLMFFNSAAYSTDILARLYNNCNEKAAYANVDDFKKVFIAKIQDKFIERECWIVQPGISIQKLKAQPKNKIHPLLNFVHSSCSQNRVVFKLVASPA